MQITAADLRRLAPKARPDIVEALAAAWPEAHAAGINSPRRARHFVAQILTETGGLRILEENLSYSAERMTQVWPRRFPTVASARPYEHQPEKLAEKVYSGRMGNGPAGSGDGWRYRGSGAMQTTGREGFRRVGHEDDPEALRQPATAIRTAIMEFVNTGCLPYADRDDLLSIRKIINVGNATSSVTPNGLAEARAWLAKCEVVFPDRADPAPIPQPKPQPESSAEPEEARPVPDGADNAVGTPLPPAPAQAPAIDVAPVPAPTSPAPDGATVNAATDMPDRPGLEILKRSKTVWGSITGTFSAGGAGWTVKSIIDSPQGPLIIGIAAVFLLIAGGALLLIFRERVRHYLEKAA